METSRPAKYSIFGLIFQKMARIIWALPVNNPGVLAFSKSFSVLVRTVARQSG
jgi:hypothetical protein